MNKSDEEKVNSPLQNAPGKSNLMQKYKISVQARYEKQPEHIKRN